MKKTILTLLLMALAATAALADDISVWDGSSYSSSLDVQDKKIYIRSANDFVALRELWDKYEGVSGSDGSGYDLFTIYLECDIDLNNHNFINRCIGWSSKHHFGGHFDGQGHTIYNLKIEGSSANRGLFGYLNGGTVRNLKLVNVDVHSGDGQSHVGALCGKMENHSTISHCAVLNGSVEAYHSGDDEIGVFAGYVDGNCNEIEYCYSNVNVTADKQVGGIAGKVDNDYGSTRSHIYYCYYTGTVTHTGNEYFAAIAGERYGNYLLKNYYLQRNDGVKGTGNQSKYDGSSDDTNAAPRTEEELKAPLLFGADNTEWVYRLNDYPELKVFFKYKEGDTFYNKSVGTMNDSTVPGYVKVVSSENSPYTVESVEFVKTWSEDSDENFNFNFTLNGDFSTYFSGQSLRMVSLAANALQSMGTLNTVTLPATLTTIGLPQRHQVQNAFYLSGSGTGFAVKDGALYDQANSRLITAPKTFSELTVRQQNADKIADYAFENMTGLNKLYIDTYVPVGTTVDDNENPAPLIALEGDSTFYGCPSGLDIYIKDGTANQLFIGKQGPGKNYGYSNAYGWKTFYYDYADKPNHMFSYYPVNCNEGGKSTLMLGYAVELPEGVTAWWAHSLSDGNVKLKPLGTQIVPALTPVLLTYKTTDPLYLTRYDGSGAGAATDYEDNLFKGSVDPGGHTMTSSEMMSNFFTLGRPKGDSSYDNLGFYRYNPKNDILPSYVAWIASSDIPAAANARLFISLDEETTPIENNILRLSPDGEQQVYTLQGIRIDPSTMQKGTMYIVNGKKFVY